MQKKIDPRVKDVLKLLGAGVLLSVAFIMPAPVAIIFKEYQKIKLERDRKEWDKYNTWRLKQVLKRLHKEKFIEIEDGVVRISKKGNRKQLKFDLQDMKLSGKRDGKWRLIIYDVVDLKKSDRDIFRLFLKQLKCLQLQKSVYLTPFICEDEIEFLRQRFQIGQEVMLITVSKLENEEAYKRYFGI